MQILKQKINPQRSRWIFQSGADVWKGFHSFTVVNFCVTAMHLPMSVDGEVGYVMTLVQSVTRVIP